MSDPVKFVYKAENGYSLTMYVEFDSHRVISSDQADDITQAEKPAYFIEEAVSHSQKVYTGKFKVHSVMRTPDNKQIDMDDDDYSTHPLGELEDKYREIVKLLENDDPTKSLGVDLRGTILPFTAIHFKDDIPAGKEGLLEGMYKGIPHWYRVESSILGREVVEAKFEEAALKAGFMPSHVQRNDERGGDWVNSL